MTSVLSLCKFCAGWRGVAWRARLHDEDLAIRFRKWSEWLSGEAPPALK
jgi:hypothetical protein